MYHNQITQQIVTFSTTCFNISAHIREYYKKLFGIELIWDRQVGALVVVS
jgi:hypothetical protein